VPCDELGHPGREEGNAAGLGRARLGLAPGTPSKLMIDITIDIRRFRLDLRVPGDSESLPVVRQALRSLGRAVRADPEALEDAELAVTEACANVVEHAYGAEEGVIEVSFEPQAASMLVSVGDYGPGMAAPDGAVRDPGFGLPMIRGIASEMEVRSREAGGTELWMLLPMGGAELSMNGRATPDAAPAERIARRLVAVIGAQTDMPSDRLIESLLAVELAARHAPRYLTGDRIHLTLGRLEAGFDLWIGPLAADGAQALVQESELPVIGAVIERLSDSVSVEPCDDPPGTERLRMRVDSRSAFAG
jgi:serine/threonine-protein kinase RsbW